MLSNFQELIVTRIPRIFQAGLPNLFFKNYRAANLFLQGRFPHVYVHLCVTDIRIYASYGAAVLERYCRSRAELQTLRASTTFQDFLRRWNLPVYFKLR